VDGSVARITVELKTVIFKGVGEPPVVTVDPAKKPAPRIVIVVFPEPAAINAGHTLEILGGVEFTVRFTVTTCVFDTPFDVVITVTFPA
jgi:hypothetical protein